MTKLGAWNKFTGVNVYLDKLLELLKEQSLTPKFDISGYVVLVKSVQDLQYTVESRYLEKSKFE